jgi:hypothetical protein
MLTDSRGLFAPITHDHGEEKDVYDQDDYKHYDVLEKSFADLATQQVDLGLI